MQDGTPDCWAPLIACWRQEDAVGLLGLNFVFNDFAATSQSYRQMPNARQAVNA